MKGIITVLLQIWCAVVVLGCNRGRRSPPPPPPPKYQPDFVGCPGDVTKLPDPGTLATVVSWTEPTAKSRNDGNRKVVVTRVGGPSPGSTFQAGSPVKIAYKAIEGYGVPPSYCSFYITVEARYCDPLAPLSQGTRNCSGSRDNIYGSVCTHTCSAGYKVNGPVTVTCESTKQWDKSAPFCKAVSCGDPGNIDNGYTVCPGGYTYSEMCSTVCNSGYMHTGSPFITCGANRVWSNASPCVDKEPPTFPNGCPDNQVLYTGPLERPVAVFWTDTDTNDNSGQLVTLTSNPARGSLLGPGFYLFKITATDIASNAASCTFVVNIQSRECDAITAPANSRVACSRGYVEGSECMVTCNRGYDIHGQALLTCLQSEQWNVDLPTCVAGGCSTPPTVENGVLKCSSGQTYLATCDLVCDAGFEVQTPPYVQCTYNGTWTTPGSCADTEPPDFPQDCPDNIEIYAASLGQPNLVTWTPPDVTDNSGNAVQLVSDIQPGSNFSVGVTRVTYTATDVIGNSKTCSLTVTVNTAVCPVPYLQPPTTQLARMLYDCPDGHVYGASCALNCTHGYPLVGSDTITCQRDDSTFPPTMTWNWAGSAFTPECTNTQCPELNAPKNGALSCNQGNFGVDCLMSCNARYDVPAKLPLDGHIYCNSGGWQPSVAPDCTVSVRPGAVRLHSDLAYFTGSCNASLDELKQNFITRMQNSNVLQDACTNVPTCTVDNVKVTCGPVSTGRRKRETLQDLGGARERNKRDASQSHFVRIDFDIAIPYQPNANQSFDDFAQALDSTNTALETSLQDAQGTFDIEGMTNYGFSPPTLHGDCPAGTTSRDIKPLSCVGCSKGLYMPDQSGQCLECAVGSYTELDNATSCTLCPQGMSTLSTGSQSQDDCVELCQEGSYSPNGFVPCLPCPPGQYQSRDGSTTCELCPVNRWTENLGAKSIQQCEPADVTLTNNSISSHVTGEWSVLTMSMYVRLPDNSSMEITITDGDDDSGLLASYVLTADGVGVTLAGQAENTSQANDTKTLPRRLWSRVLIVLVAPGANVTQLPAEVSVVSLTRQPSMVTTIKVHTTNRRVAVSGLIAIGRYPTQEEITAASTSCMGNNSDENLLTWSAKASVISMPSACDAVNDCLPNPCGQHGDCEDRYQDFKCSCRDGRTGLTCHVPPNSCYQHQCQNGATCVSGNGTYTCDCPPEFVGDKCEDQIVDGGYGEWSPWSQCSGSCGGQQQRLRPCNNPAPQHGGQNCTGEDSVTRACGELVCIVNGSWSDWTTWSDCSATCGGGEATRQRTCEKPPDASDNEVAVCDGYVTREVQSCNTVPCPVDGNWSIWKPWSTCSVSCGDGTQSRDRSCDNPVPANGGIPCSGPSTQDQQCNLQECPECNPRILPRPTGGIWGCTVTQTPYLRNCSLTCLDGYVIAENPPPFTCGEATSYLWNNQRDHSTETQAELPTCTLPSAMKSASYKQYTTMNAGCDESTNDAVVDGIRQNLVSSVVCLQHGVCALQLSSGCSAPDRGKRSAPSLALTMLFSLDLPNITGNVTGQGSTYQRLLDLVDQSFLQTNQTENLLTLTLGGQTITPIMTSVSSNISVTCPPGTVFMNNYCVPCPAGSKAEDDQCVLCPLGQYQDQPSSDTCKPCPDDRTWDIVGANDVTQCRYPKDPHHFPTGKPPPGDHEGKGPNLAMIISLACLGSLALLGFVLAALYKWKHVKAARSQRPHMGSMTSFNKVGPSNTPRWTDPPPAYTVPDPPVLEEKGHALLDMARPPVDHRGVSLPPYPDLQ